MSDKGSDDDLVQKPSHPNTASDIFGDSDDSDNEFDLIPSFKKKVESDNDDGWDDSDNDGPRISSSSRLKSSKAAKPKKSKKPTVADIFGSEDEDDDDMKLKTTKTKKRKKKIENTKLSKKLKQDNSSGIADQSGDEYDSGDDVVRTKEDDAFIDDEDDQEDIVKEYDEDNQDFSDERPDAYKKSKKLLKRQSRPEPSSRSSKSETKSNDPLSETIASLKKQKETQLSQSEKENFVKDLLQKMSIAAAKDDDCLLKGEPAVYKLQLLDGVRKAVALNQLHESLMENDILTRFKEWIEPKADANQTLPSLTVRTAVYEMLLVLPCYTEHLKQSRIGITIMALRKHKEETISNKKLLRDLVEKWCRPIFGKSTEQRSRDLEYNDDLKIAAARQKLVSSSHDESMNVSSILSGETTSKASDAKARVRTPFNNGYIFTVRPESRSVEKRDVLKEKLGESRMNIMKLTKTRRAGVKDNFRAVKVDLSGRDKS